MINRLPSTCWFIIVTLNSLVPLLFAFALKASIPACIAGIICWGFIMFFIDEELRKKRYSHLTIRLRKAGIAMIFLQLVPVIYIAPLFFIEKLGFDFLEDQSNFIDSLILTLYTGSFTLIYILLLTVIASIFVKTLAVIREKKGNAELTT